MTSDDRETVAGGAAAVAAIITAVAAYRGTVPAGNLPSLYAEMHDAVTASILGAVEPQAEQAVEVEKPTPAQIRKSVTDEGLISFIDGKTYKTLKRHLTAHGLDPSGYRERYGLPADYPMVAPAYAAQRSDLAKRIGLGRPGAMAESSTTQSLAA